MKTAAVIVALIVIPLSSATREIRPIRDDVGFCWNAGEMKKLIGYLAAGERGTIRKDGLVAAISPHDDYLYAGRIYYPLYRVLRTREVVIFGVTHSSVRKEIGDPQQVIILDEYPLWPGVMKPIPVSPLREWIKERLAADCFLASNRAHDLEHSIEAQLPFLQYFNADVAITPIMVTAMPLAKMDEISEKLAAVIAAYMKEKGLRAGREIFFLVSADANHYGKDFDNSPYGEDAAAHEKALAVDRRLIQTYLEGSFSRDKLEALTGEIWGATYRDPGKSLWCGRYSIPFGLLTIAKTVGMSQGGKISGTLFRFSDTRSGGVIPLLRTGMGITAPFSFRHWVSFFSAGFYLEK